MFLRFRSLHAEESEPGCCRHATSARAQLALLSYTCLPICTHRAWLLQARKFKIINTSTQEANFELDRKLLERAGFAVSQDKAIKLAGAPEHESVEVGLTLQVPLRLCVCPSSLLAWPCRCCSCHHYFIGGSGPVFSWYTVDLTLLMLLLLSPRDVVAVGMFLGVPVSLT